MHRLSALDLSLVAIYLAGITIFGLQFRSKDRSLKNYFSLTGKSRGGPSPSLSWPRKPVP